MYLPAVQFTPDHPLLQMQLYEPAVLVQLPSFLHGFWDEHSLISESPHTMIYKYVQYCTT